ncbi:MAG TPA: 2OG-Fe(II) oxygenase [Allosphingosinicella sp.]|nr:2OG-Fe(II) oxygenase [Allosphingosinicella sp.]
MSGEAGAGAVYPAAPLFRSPIRIGGAETRVLDPAMIADIRRAVTDFGGAVFHDVIEPELFKSLAGSARKAAFRQVDLEEYGLRGNDLSVEAALPFCMTLARPAFMEWLEEISGCDPIAHIEGHLVEMQAGNNLGWHRDAGLGIRRLALVINLTDCIYEGGDFELRRRSTRAPMFGYHAATPGSLAVFRLAQDLEHQVTLVRSGGPRTTFSGWARGPLCAGDEMRGRPLGTWPPLAPAGA